jgi:hypothetical protein
VLEIADALMAGGAEEPAHFARGEVLIDGQAQRGAAVAPARQGFRATADRAEAFLRFIDCLLGEWRHTVSSYSLGVSTPLGNARVVGSPSCSAACSAGVPPPSARCVS